MKANRDNDKEVDRTENNALLYPEEYASWLLLEEQWKDLECHPLALLDTVTRVEY